MTVLTCFDECTKVVLSLRRSKLATALKPALALEAGGFNRARTNGPTASGRGLIIHAAGMFGKIILFPSNDFTTLTAPSFECGDGCQNRRFLSVP